MREWPTADEVHAYLLTTRSEWGTDGWRALAEIAGHFECPRFERLSVPCSQLVADGLAERREVADGPSLYRARRTDGL